MGPLTVTCQIENQRDRTRWVRVPDVSIDTDSELTWISREHLVAIGVEPEKRDRRLALANAQEVTRSIGFGVIRVGEDVTTDELIIAEPGDLQVLGARTLRGLGLRVDSTTARLVAAEPFLVAEVSDDGAIDEN
ncbi:MAG: hypothetical protein OXH04_22310 [Acidobacteria bacterium]|nr:hypothetical protein [Acidobacteriota bacterium]